MDTSHAPLLKRLVTKSAIWEVSSTFSNRTSAEGLKNLATAISATPSPKSLWGTRSLDITDKLKPSIKNHLPPREPLLVDFRMVDAASSSHTPDSQIPSDSTWNRSTETRTTTVNNCWSCSRRSELSYKAAYDPSWIQVTLPPLRSSRRRRLESEGTPLPREKHPKLCLQA